MITATHSHSAATVTALRPLSIRRSWWRISGRAMPLSINRSVGKTSGRASGSATMVGAMCGILHISNR